MQAPRLKLQLREGCRETPAIISSLNLVCVCLFLANVHPFAINPFIPSFSKHLLSMSSALVPCSSQTFKMKETEALPWKTYRVTKDDQKSGFAQE